MLRKLFLLLFVAFVVIQFFQPAKNDSRDYNNDITSVYSVPDSIEYVLKKSCNDCHSNYTVYPWYNKIQPVAWWLQNHINEGKRHLNFSEFATYSTKKQAHKLHEIAEEIEESEMPLSSYTFIHSDAKLSKEESKMLIAWAKNLSLKINPNQQEKEHH